MSTTGALIVIGDATPALFGLDWIELRIREVARAGIRHIVVVAPRVASGVVTVLDRLRAEGIDVAVVRDATDVGDRFETDATVLVIGGTMMIGARVLDALAQGTVPVVLCVGDAADTAAFERIDAATRWSGYARLAGPMVRQTARMVGDWDLGSTLLRHAVQHGVARDMLAQLPIDAVHADRAVRARLEAGTLASTGWGTRYLVAPVTRALVLGVHAQAETIVRLLPAALAAAGVGAIAAASVGWPGLAAVLVLFAATGLAVGTRFEDAAGLRLPAAVACRRGSVGAAALALLLAMRSMTDTGPLILAVVVVALMVLLARLPGERDAWLADVPGQAALMLFGALGGTTGIVAAVAVMAVHSFVSLAVRQNTLSKALIPTR